MVDQSRRDVMVTQVVCGNVGRAFHCHVLGNWMMDQGRRDVMVTRVVCGNVGRAFHCHVVGGRMTNQSHHDMMVTRVMCETDIVDESRSMTSSHLVELSSNRL